MDDLNALSEGLSPVEQETPQAPPADTPAPVQQPQAPQAPQAAAEVPPWEQRAQQRPTPQPQIPQQPQAPEQQELPPWEQRAKAQALAQPDQGPGWLSKENLLETAKTVGQLSSLPGLAKSGFDYWTGQHNQRAAAYSGMQDMVAGNLPDTLYELGKGGIKELLHGGGPDSAEQARRDDLYKTQLMAQHPAATWGGRILGLLGMVGGAEGLGATAATKVPQIANTLAGKVAWASLISGGQGALSGFSGSRDWDERVSGAKNGALLGGLLGGVAGAAGAKLEQMAGKSAAATQAEHFGLEHNTPLSGQQEAYGQAMSKVIPEASMSIQDAGQAIKDKAVDLLRLAGTKDATLSADGVKSIAANLAPMLKANHVDVGRDLAAMSPGAQKAWNQIETLAMDAATSPTGKISLADVATYGRLINSFGKEQDPGGYYNAIRGAYNKFMQDAMHSNMFSGDASAIRDYEQFRMLYPIGAQLDSNTALAKIFDHHHSANEVANWLTNSAQVGQQQAAVQLGTSLKALLNESSPEWQALQSLLFRNIAAPSGGPGPKLAQVLTNFAKTPLAQTMYTDAQREVMGKLGQGLSVLPTKAPSTHGGHLGELVLGGLGAEQGFEKGWEHGSEDAGWTEKLWHGLLGATLGGLGGMALPHLKGAAARVAGPGAAVAARTGIPFAANKAVVPNMGWPFKRGGSVSPKRRPEQIQANEHANKRSQEPQESQNAHLSSPSVNRALYIARRARNMDEGGALDNGPEPTFSSQDPPPGQPAPGNPMDDPAQMALGPDGQSESMGKVSSGLVGQVNHALHIPQHMMTSSYDAAPSTPGQWTDQDEGNLQANQDKYYNDANTLSRLAMTGATPMAPRGALGSFGGKLKAYHGSPFDFEKFNISKIGTGEGAQAYGHGLYFSERPEVAEGYRKRLAPGDTEHVRPDEKAIAAIKPEWDATVVELRPLRAERDRLYYSGEPYRELDQRVGELSDKLDALNARAVADTVERNPHLLKGRLYQVSIDAESEHFLDWDKPLSEQHPKVREALGKTDYLYHAERAGKENATGGDFIANVVGDHASASEKLREAGIPGIKYLDQGSRGISREELLTDIAQYKDEIARMGSATELDMRGRDRLDVLKQRLADREDRLANWKPETHNYVVFDDKLIDILKKYGLAGLTGTTGLMAAIKTRQQQQDSGKQAFRWGGAANRALAVARRRG